MRPPLVRVFAAVAVLVLPACVTQEVVAPPTGTLLPSIRATDSAPEDARPFTGLRLESQVSGSLMELEFAPGLEVTAVIAGSPAEDAGMRIGDRVVKVDGTVIETPDQFDALLLSGRKMQLDVERDGGVAKIELQPRRRDSANEWRPQYYAERLKARFAARNTEISSGRFACEVVEIEHRSPLEQAGVQVGDRIVSLDGEEVSDSARLMQAIAQREYGQQITLGVDRGGSIVDIEVELFAPPRRITGVGIPVVFRYRRDLVKHETHVSVVDLWLFAFYAWSREGETRRHELLGFTIWETGVGEIASDEDPREDESDEGEPRE